MAELVSSVREPVTGAAVGPTIAFVGRDGVTGARLLPLSTVQGQAVFGDGGPPQQAQTMTGCTACVGWPLPALAEGSPLKITARVSGTLIQNASSNPAKPSDGLEEPFEQPLTVTVGPDGDGPETVLVNSVQSRVTVLSLPFPLDLTGTAGDAPFGIASVRWWGGLTAGSTWSAKAVSVVRDQAALGISRRGPFLRRLPPSIAGRGCRPLTRLNKFFVRLSVLIDG